ncbi:hypothetical protein ELH57_08810 [Rhizobium ruizarguesonis]|nr:hypothetical protein ELH57_08810 [Rhizobium ruizarguesonis]TBY90621.1 hypothetical protein E0H40_13740 [Rhizobium leguminosarum bv. viciae]
MSTEILNASCRLGSGGDGLREERPALVWGLVIVSEIAAVYDLRLSLENRVEGGFRAIIHSSLGVAHDEECDWRKVSAEQPSSHRIQFLAANPCRSQAPIAARTPASRRA